MDTLTYYSKDSINIGDLVSVNIGQQKNIKALVIDSDTLINRKQDVKSKDWATKKINHVIMPSLIPAGLLYSILEASAQYGLPTGTLLSLLFTKKFWENTEKTTTASGIKRSEEISNKKPIISDQKEVAKSILYIVPTANEVKYKQKLLISEHNNSPTKNKKDKEDIKPNIENIIVSTPCLDYLVKNNIQEVIWSDYESSYYIHPHYKINMGELLEYLFLKKERSPYFIIFKKEKYIYNLDRVEVLRDEYKYITPLISAVTDKLIKNLYQNLKENEIKNTSSISKDTKNYEIINKKGKILIYANRKGESPLSRCYDCGLDLLCPNCDLPLVLHKQDTTQVTRHKYYLCHHCGHRKDLEMPNIKAANEIDDSRVHMNALTCNHCGSWRIMPIGISTGSVQAHTLEKYSFVEGYKNLEKLYIKKEDQKLAGQSSQSIKQNYKDIKKESKLMLYRIDDEVTSTDKKVKDILKAWDETGGILITNDKGLFNAHIKEIDIAYSIVISLDGMYSIPDPMIEKRILHIINRLNAITSKQVIVHTHLYENTIFKLIEDKKNLQANIEKYDTELKKKIDLIDR